MNINRLRDLVFAVCLITAFLVAFYVLPGLLRAMTP